MARISNTKAFQKENKRYYAPITYFMITEQDDDIYFRVTRGTRLDTIAQRVYNDSSLWWIIASVNNLDLTDYCLSDDKVIRVPNPNRIDKILTDISDGQEI